MAKYQHVNSGQVVEVLPGAEHEHWTPDHQGHDPQFARDHPKMWQPKPWWAWDQWTPVHDNTPVTPPVQDADVPPVQDADTKVKTTK
ncbi:hypothetical protein [Nocardia sp. NBC_01327]|uniref:hypothetical protein n=1 Tax=Nocardia sp. NBC_01327 TaxID=2903593 RepID=UPI002E11F685|nr:hypothetical protein OG326_23810 [Nocardia sp. NBC_01327]